MSPYPFWGMPQHSMRIKPPLAQPPSQPQSIKPRKVAKSEASQCMETKAYPDFKFNHMFSMLVVGPSQCGKTYFVEQVLTKNCVHYPNKKPRHIYWFYNQWQSRYKSLQSFLGDEIQFTQGLPELSEDLHEINPKCNNVLVFDDLMSQTADSPVLSKLFTQGRHRNASVILLLQNMFPKGKFNTDISRNAQYMVLFRSPSDRKQIDIMAERIFAKDRPNFMSAYAKETAKPYGYVLIDNQPKTTSDKQVVSDVFGYCQSYPSISRNPAPEVTQGTLKTMEPGVKKEPVKRKVELTKPPAKKPRKQLKPTKKQSKAKPNAKKPHNTKKQSKPAKKQPKRKQSNAKKTKKQPKRTKPVIYKPRFSVTPPRESSDVEQFNSEEEKQFSSEDDHFNMNELVALAAQDKQRNGFGPRFTY